MIVIIFFRGLEYLHNSEPKIVHKNLSCSHIYINSGTSDLRIGDTWLAGILSDSQDIISFSSSWNGQHSQLTTMPVYLAPEVFDDLPVTTAVREIP